MLLLYSLLTAVGSSTASAATTDRPPVQIWMNNDRRFREGERVRLQVDAQVDGYLLVLNYDTDGRIRVLFPLDPRDDAAVRAGRRYELRDEGGESAFRAGQDGAGFIYSAISRDPWRFDDVVLADRWDYSRLSIDRRSDNPESALTDLVQSLSGPGGFDYDLAGYRVYGNSYNISNYGDYYGRAPIYVYDDYYLCNDWYSRWYGCRSWPYGGWSFGFGYYGSYYRPYGYGYYPYSPYYYPYYPYGGSTTYRRPTIVGRPRSYTINPHPPTGTGSHSVGGNVGSPSLPPVNWRPRSVARPVSGGARGPEAPRGPEVSRGGGPAGGFMPPARRARPEGDGFSRPPSGGERVRGGDFSPRGGERARGDGNSRGEARGPSEPRSYAPPPPARPADRGQTGGHDGGRSAPSGGGGGGHSSGGEHSAPGRSRRP